MTLRGEEILCTPGHPFYSPVKGWTEACRLRAGDILVLVNGEYVVVEQVQHELLEVPVQVYNLEVEDFHTYFVSGCAVLVHNKCGNGPTSPNKVNDNALKDVDVHGFKDDILKSNQIKESISHYNIYKDTANNSMLWLGNNAKTRWINTGYSLATLIEHYTK